jgi:cobalamin 5'-phosphate synthase/cobalamin synthase
VRSFFAGVAFLTRFPVGKLVNFDAADVAHSSAWFPLIGLLLGAIYAFAAALFQKHLPPAAIAVLLVVFDALLTGALHFDGLADTADGFGGGKTRDDVLRIMRDHAIGSYGGLALAALVALKTTAYTALLQQNNWLPALFLTPALGRWSMLLLTAALPYARPSASVIEGMGRRSLFWGTVPVVIALVVAQSPRGWFAWAVTAAATAAFGLYCRHRIAGITGDTLGANLQLCESAALLTLLWTTSPQ